MCIKVRLILLFLVSAWYTQAQIEGVQYHYADGRISAEGFMLNGKPSGFWKNYYPNGKLSSAGKMQDGKTDSIWCFYAETGNLKGKTTFSAGIKEGIREAYNEQGQLLSSEYFIGNKRNGPSQKYHAKGGLKEIIPFQNDREQGRGFELNEQGNIITVMEYNKGSLVERRSVNRFDAGGRKNGVWIETYSNLVIRKEMLFKDGEPEGYMKWFDPEGKLIRVDYYSKGQLLAEKPRAEQVKAYFPNKKLKQQGNFMGKIPVGQHLSFDSSGLAIQAEIYDWGTLIEKGPLDENMNKTEIWEEFYPDGQRKAIGAYKKGQKEGKWTYYHQNGQVEQSGKYVGGKPDGLWLWYYENGNLLRETGFNRGLEDGESYELDERGDTLSKGRYLDDEREGLWYFKQGFMSITGYFVAGKPDGNWIFKNEAGVIRFQGSFAAGEGIGVHKAFYDKGQPRWEGSYRNGKRNGVWRSYNEDGSQAISIEYLDGVEIRYDGVKIQPEFLPEEWDNLMHHNPYMF